MSESFIFGCSEKYSYCRCLESLGKPNKLELARFSAFIHERGKAEPFSDVSLLSNEYL